MSKKMLINASHPEENRVAIVVDGILSELDIEIAGQEQTKGNIYKAVVVRVETGLQAAFVDYGAEKLGFLQIGEIHPSLYPGKDETKGRPRINDLLHRGQEILVQIVKEERGNKGAALTTFLSLPGRYMVLMPDSTTKGVSRKISDDSERKKLKKTMAELDLPERMGYIVRTAGIGKEKEELKRDFDYLVRLYEGIIARKDQVKAPAQLYRESNLVIRSIRDYFSSEMDEVLIDDSKIYQDAKDFFALVMPELTHLVKQHREKRPIFSRFQIEEQIETLARNQIPLPSGGSIVIDQTEALVAIDVNSGKLASESGIEATAARTNLEAAAEVGRQLRLRDLGGLIVIDFIDMRDRKHIREVEQELRKALKEDKAKVTVGRISQFGLLEMSRQRLKPTLSVGAYLECPHCQGKGRIKSAEAQAVAFLRQAHAAASKGQIGQIEARVPLNVASYLLNQKRSTLNELEQRLNLQITIIGRTEYSPGQLEIELHKREKAEDNSREIAPVTHANQIESALAARLEEQEMVDEMEEESPDLQPAEEETAEKKGRKRRRKRRRKSDRRTGEGVESDQLQPESAEPLTGVETEQPEGKDRITAEPEAERQATTSETAAASEEKPKRRPRRSRKPIQKAGVESPADKPELPAIAPDAEESQAAKLHRGASDAVAEAAPPEPTTELKTADATEPKPKRPRRRATPKAAAESASEQPTKETEALETSEEASQSEPQKAAAETVAKNEDNPKRRPRRPPRKATAEAGTELPAAEVQVAEAVEKPPSRARRSTQKPAAEKPAETASEDKPKRRTRSTPKKTAEESGSEQPAAEDKPKRPRRTARKKTATESEPAETQVE